MNLTEIVHTIIMPSILGPSLALMLIFFYLFELERERRLKAEDQLLIYANKDNLFTKRKIMRTDELELFHKLVNMLSKNYRIFPQSSSFGYYRCKKELERSR